MRIVALVGVLALGCFGTGETEREEQGAPEASATYCVYFEPLTHACRAGGAGVGMLCDGRPSSGAYVPASDVSELDVARLPGAWCAT